MPVLALLVLGVFAEIATFILVGRSIGVVATLALVALSTILGLMLVRALGLDALRRAEASLQRGEDPSGAVFDAASIALAAVLLALPGFLSDIVALMLLVAPLRRWIGGMLWRRLQASPNVRVWKHSSGADIVEGEYVEIIEGKALPRRDAAPEDRNKR